MAFVAMAMKRVLPAIGLVMICVAPPAGASAETLTALFTRPDGGVTTGLYDGRVRLTVAQAGQAAGASFNDAFYVFTGGPIRHFSSYYQLSFATSPLLAYDPARDAARFLVGGLPAYQSSHVYSFVLDTRVAVPTRLHFGVSDEVFVDNSGAYTITIAEVPHARIPEPASLPVLGGGLVALAALRARAVSRTVKPA